MKFKKLINNLVVCFVLSFAYMFLGLAKYPYFCLGLLLLYFLYILCHATVIPTLSKMMPFVDKLVGTVKVNSRDIVATCSVYLVIPMLIIPWVCEFVQLFSKMLSAK